MIDPRKLEAELARIFRGHGIRLTGFHGELYVGICSTLEGDSGVYVPSMPSRSVAVSLTTLAREIAGSE